MCKETAIKEEKCELKLYLFTYLILTKSKKFLASCVDQTTKKQTPFPGKNAGWYCPFEVGNAIEIIDTFPFKHSDPDFETLDYRYIASIK